MIATLESATLYGLEVIPIAVEVDLAAGLPGMTIVGLPNKAVEEAKERVKSGLTNSGFKIAPKRITINLAPADVKKEGASFDLAIAAGILIAQEIIPKNALQNSWVLGEVALTGEIRNIRGVLPIVRMAQRKNIKQIFIPTVNSDEAAIIEGVAIYPVENIFDLVAHLRGEKLIEPILYQERKQAEPSYEYDLAYVKGQEYAKRALEVAAAGGHNILLSGPPGSGKTLLARCLPSIMPPMTRDEQLEVSQIYSAVGLLSDGLMLERPFRSPHHTTSNIALVGGGSIPKPGEVTLAHMGILFLDELPEFPRSVLEALRQPIEDGIVTIARAQGTVRFPAKFTLIAAQNPCPCGFLTDPTTDCVCSAYQIIQYQKKISGPILDRIDLHVEVPRVSSENLTQEVVSESSQQVKARVLKARKLAQVNFKDKARTNATLTNRELKEIDLSPEVKTVLKNAVDQLHLSARAYHRIIKVSLTIANLAGLTKIEPGHVAEALQYRFKKDNLG